MPVEPATRLEIQALREQMNLRFTSMERWIERATEALDRLAENRTQIVEVRGKLELLEHRVTSNERADEKSEAERRDLLKQVTRLSVMASGAVAIGLIVVEFVLKGVLG